MRVAVAPNMGCGVCDRCVSGNTQLCAAFQAFGINIDGGFAEHLLVPAAAVRQGNLSEMPAGRRLRGRRRRRAALVRVQRVPALRHRAR